MFQAEPDRPGSFRAVKTAGDSIQHSEVLIGQISESTEHSLAAGSPQRCEIDSRGADPFDAGKPIGENSPFNAAAGGDKSQGMWQVKNTFLSFTPPSKPMRSVRTAEGALCTLAENADED